MDKALRQKIIAVSEKYNTDPALSLKYADSAVHLENLISSEDSVIWPLYCGGAAWLALRGEKTPTGGVVRGVTKRRIILVTEKLSFQGQMLFLKLSDMASKKNLRIVNYFLEYECPGINTEKEQTWNGSICKFFRALRTGQFKRKKKTDSQKLHDSGNNENNFSPLRVNADNFTGTDLFSGNSDIQSNNTETENIFMENAGGGMENLLYIPNSVFSNERSALVTAARQCSLNVVAEIKSPEDLTAAYLYKNPYLDKETGNIIYYWNSSPDNIAAPLLSTGFPAAVLFVKSDLAGALEWAYGLEKPVVIISASKKTLPGGRKIKWSPDVFSISSKKTNTDKAGELINLIIPGYLLSTALNAYRYLSEKGFNIKITVSGVLIPADFSAYKSSEGGNNELQIVADFRRSIFIYGLSSAYPGEFHYTDQVSNGSVLAGAVEKICRNFRFSKIVDDVKKDKWR